MPFTSTVMSLRALLQPALRRSLAASTSTLRVRSLQTTADSSSLVGPVPSDGDTPFKIKLHQEYFQSYRCDLPDLEMDVTKNGLVEMYKTMVTMRRMEMAADQVRGLTSTPSHAPILPGCAWIWLIALFKFSCTRPCVPRPRLSRLLTPRAEDDPRLLSPRHRPGTSRLWREQADNSQEAVSVGMHSAIRKADNIITAYRCHPFAVLRGGTIKGVIAELLGTFSPERSLPLTVCSPGRVDGMSHGKGGSMYVVGPPPRAHC